ncbi:hypothetical protein [Halobacillus sp. A5]|uniref:hypothetical protein n=1 Tax=Halobacillus sp. A5 TaxID=2880263 RepID=UPI0020A656A9|nr:hypothetical protein [Halobacillus sp. A5]MCP3029011.1 hypothetical protein [Halobacillus sp. A5]
MSFKKRKPMIILLYLILVASLITNFFQFDSNNELNQTLNDTTEKSKDDFKERLRDVERITEENLETDTIHKSELTELNYLFLQLDKESNFLLALNSKDKVIKEGEQNNLEIFGVISNYFARKGAQVDEGGSLSLQNKEVLYQEIKIIQEATRNAMSVDKNQEEGKFIIELNNTLEESYRSIQNNL